MGVPQSLDPYPTVTTLEGGRQTIALGPIASLAESGGDLVRLGEHDQLERVFDAIGERALHFRGEIGLQPVDDALQRVAAVRAALALRVHLAWRWGELVITQSHEDAVTFEHHILTEGERRGAGFATFEAAVDGTYTVSVEPRWSLRRVVSLTLVPSGLSLRV